MQCISYDTETVFRCLFEPRIQKPPVWAVRPREHALQCECMTMRWPDCLTSERTVHSTISKGGRDLKQITSKYKMGAIVSLAEWHFSSDTVQLSLCLLKLHDTKAYGEEEVNLHLFLTPTPVGSEWSTSRHATSSLSSRKVQLVRTQTG